MPEGQVGRVGVCSAVLPLAGDALSERRKMPPLSVYIQRFFFSPLLLCCSRAIFH